MKAARPETNRLYRTVCRWKEIEVLIITEATIGKVEANHTAFKNIKRTTVAIATQPITNQLFS